MNELIRIGTWNLCLGLANKKDYVTSKLHDEKINICCLQECEIDPNQDEKTLTLPNYKIELEDNEYKKRTAIYIHNSVEYERQRHLEEPNNHIVIIDLKCKKEYRIINVYCSFSPNNNITPTERFKNQLKIIKNAMNANPNKKNNYTRRF